MRVICRHATARRRLNALLLEKHLLVLVMTRVAVVDAILPWENRRVTTFYIFFWVARQERLPEGYLGRFVVFSLETRINKV